MADKSCSDQFSDNGSEVRSQSLHSVLKIFLEWGSVVSHFCNLVAKCPDVFLISLTDLSTHGDLRGILDILFDVFRQDSAQVCVNGLISHTNGFNYFGVDEVVRHDFSHLGEMPSIPLFKSHGVVVNLLVKFIKKRNSLDDHDIDLLCWEFQLVSG